MRAAVLASTTPAETQCSSCLSRGIAIWGTPLASYFSPTRHQIEAFSTKGDLKHPTACYLLTACVFDPPPARRLRRNPSMEHRETTREYFRVWLCHPRSARS